MKKDMTFTQKLIVIICAVLFGLFTFASVTPYLDNIYNNIKNNIESSSTDSDEDDKVDFLPSVGGGIVDNNDKVVEV